MPVRNLYFSLVIKCFLCFINADIKCKLIFGIIRLMGGCCVSIYFVPSGVLIHRETLLALSDKQGQFSLNHDADWSPLFGHIRS